MNLQATAVKIMMAINNLTPDVKNKSSDPDWFLLRQQIEKGLLDAYKAGMSEAAEIQMSYAPSEHYECQRAIFSTRDNKSTL